MNPFCNEDDIRKTADWRAFKRGNDLLPAVVEATSTDAGWRGAVRDCGKLLRVAVIAKSATDLEARCPCRENQSTGIFCAHAVAIGIALVKQAAASSSTCKMSQGNDAPRARIRQAIRGSSSVPASSDDGRADIAWRIEFPPPWRRLLLEGRLSVRVVPTDGCQDPADQQLSRWLRAAGAISGGMLLLEDDPLEGFLRAVVDHPRLQCPGGAIEISGDGLLRIRRVERSGDRVVVTPESKDLRSIGDMMFEVGESGILLMKHAPWPEFVPWASGKSIELGLDRFLEWVESSGDRVAWPMEGWLADLRFLPAPLTIRISLAMRSGVLVARPMVRYHVDEHEPKDRASPNSSVMVTPGASTVAGLPILIGNECLMRNVDVESAVIRDLENFGFSHSRRDPSEWDLPDGPAMTDFFNHGMRWLRERYEIIEGEGLAKRLREFAVVEPKFEMMAGGRDWLEFNLGFVSAKNEERIDFGEVWRCLKSGGDKQRARISRDVTEVIDPLFSELDLVQEGGRFIARGASAECIRSIIQVQRDPHGANAAEEAEFQLPATVSATLRPYQRSGVAWLCDRLETFHGALLADDMGLGKTIQTLIAIEWLFECIPRLDDSSGESVLVVVPTSLLGTWHAEFGKFAPGRRVRIFHGGGRDEEKQSAKAGEVWLTSYGTLARDLAWYLRHAFLAVIVDEASLMRNPETEHSKAIFKLKARYRLALTGTPVENGIRDLWSIFHFIQPGWLGGRREFRDRYELPASQGDDGVFRRLRIKTAPFVLRRTKQQVAKDLPSKTIINEFVDLTRSQQAIYRELLEQGRRGVEKLTDARQLGAARMQLLTALLRLRQACCDLALLGGERLQSMGISERSAKLQRLHELIDQATSGGHKILVFSQFKTQLTIVLESLRERGVDALQLDGSTRNRQELVDRFQSANGPPVFLISLKAGGYGLNLTAADIVIHFDPWWNPAAEAQASDRAHRIGQLRPVTVYRLLTRGTVEEKIVQLQDRKRTAAMAIDESGAGDPGDWSEQELAKLFDSSLEFPPC